MRLSPVQLLGEGLTVTFLGEVCGHSRIVLGLAIDDDPQRYRLETSYAPPADPARAPQRPPIDELSDEEIEALIMQSVSNLDVSGAIYPLLGSE
jgi:hypothetical protein